VSSVSAISTHATVNGLRTPRTDTSTPARLNDPPSAANSHAMSPTSSTRRVTSTARTMAIARDCIRRSIGHDTASDHASAYANAIRPMYTTK
jgi:hypothetical protein